MMNQQQLQKLVEQGKLDIASGKKTDWQVAKELEHAATGKSQDFTDLRTIQEQQQQQQASGPTQVGLPSGPANLYGHPSVPADPQFPSPSANPPLSEAEQRSRDAQIMQGVEPTITVNGGNTGLIDMQDPTQPVNIYAGQRQVPGARDVPNYHPQSMTPPRNTMSPGNQQVPGPRDVPQVQQPGLFDRLKSAGRGMNGYMKSLFDDPQRMAMLQGGLSMMDPNTYYDKQGFGSVFTGLNRGLGAAQQGHKGVLDRRTSNQAIATAKAAAEKARRGGAYSTVEVGPNQLQLQKDGTLLGSPFAKGYKPIAGKNTYKTITENTENGGTVKVNYRMDASGNKIEESRADVTKIVAGVNKDGKLTVQQWNDTTQSAKDIVVKKTDFTPDQVMGAVNILNQLDRWDKLLTENPVSSSEFPGKAASIINWLSESFNQGTPFQGRAEIDTMIAQLKPMMTPEILKDSRISEAEWKIAKAALGMGKWSTGMDKRRAIPALKKVIRIRSGLALEGEVGSVGGPTSDDQSYNHLF